MARAHLKNNFIVKKIVEYFGDLRAKEFIEKIRIYLPKKGKILDIGAGTCQIAELLLKKGHNVLPLDVENLSFVDGVNPKIYDGAKMPFKKKSFDFSLLLTVLHHTPNPEAILKEAKKVSKKIIIMEDIYFNKFHRFLTHFFDSLLNLEFKNHPHSNKSDEEWKKLFKQMGFKLVGTNYHNFLMMRIATYCVEA